MKGHLLDAIKKCTTRKCILALGAKSLEAKKMKNEKTAEVFRVMKAKTGLNYARAAGHGVMDVMTLGLWEVVGTPAEVAISNNRKFYTIKVIYSDDNESDIDNLKIYTSDNKIVN